jgi:beta-lactamase superfamily II metal-dependent hydrolase
MKLIIYQAECGDAARIEYNGSDGQLHHVLIDSGFERTFRKVLAAEIKTIEKTSGYIDLWIISHIHDDHIGGAIAYIKGIRKGLLPDIVHRWIYNPPRGSMSVRSGNRDEASTAKSIAQGDQLASFILSKETKSDIDYSTSTESLKIHGLQITFLSPDSNSLAALRKKYEPERHVPLEREEDFAASTAKSATSNDYATKLTDFDLESSLEDNSIENASSISILASFQGKNMLWLADAHSSLIIQSLQALGYTTTNPLICDWIKLSHHGSSGNNLSSLFAIVRCNNYLISANGSNKYRLPNKECLARILLNKHRAAEKCHLYFTYDNSTLRSIFSTDGPGVYNKLNFETHFFTLPATPIDC